MTPREGPLTAAEIDAYRLYWSDDVRRERERAGSPWAVLSWIDDHTGVALTFRTKDYQLQTGDWNGFPILLLPKWQAHVLEYLINDDVRWYPPSIVMDENESEECAYVWADGYTWELIDSEESPHGL